MTQSRALGERKVPEMAREVFRRMVIATNWRTQVSLRAFQEGFGGEGQFWTLSCRTKARRKNCDATVRFRFFLKGLGLVPGPILGGGNGAEIKTPM